MRYFELVEPRSLREACAILAADSDAKAVAGGTALLTVIKQGLLRPKRLVNLKKVLDGAEIDYDPVRGLRIGAMATISEIESSPIVRQHFPALAEACHVVANIRIRNMATIGGNLVHADYQSDPPTMLSVFDPRVEIMSAAGKRELNLSDFQLGSYETALEPHELLSAVLIPPPPQGAQGHYIKFTSGSSAERPCAGVAALAQLDHGVCRELRLAVGAVSPRPVRIKAEALARDKAFSDELIGTIAAAASQAIDPIDDLSGPAEYKRHLVAVLARRAINALANGKQEPAS